MRILKKSDYRIIGMTLLYTALLLLIFKVSGLIEASWLIVFCPIWAPALGVGVFVLMDKISAYIIDTHQ